MSPKTLSASARYTRVCSSEAMASFSAAAPLSRYLALLTSSETASSSQYGSREIETEYQPVADASSGSMGMGSALVAAESWSNTTAGRVRCSGARAASATAYQTSPSVARSCTSRIYSVRETVHLLAIHDAVR